MAEPLDPALDAIITFVEEMCDTAVASCTGFHNASAVNERRERARAVFIRAMEKLETEGGP